MKYLVFEFNDLLYKGEIDKIKNIRHPKVNFKSSEYRALLSNSVIITKLKKNVESLELKDYEELDRIITDIVGFERYHRAIVTDYEQIKHILKPPINRTVKAKSSKQKGKRLENVVAELFQKKLNLPKGTVHRAQSSGTFLYDIGDIRFNIPIPMIVECKNTESWNYKQFFNKNNELPSIFKKWIEQIEDEVNKAKELYPNIFKNGAVWFLIFSKNNEPIYILIRESTLQNLMFGQYDNMHLNEITLDSLPYLKVSIYYIFKLEDFLDFLSIYT